uniref:Uncharacterized protein n=1 Tax=Pithovirus LCPAC102 TaxID=2506587 RepID=A0A481Z3W1_9VIRU|nr:MAG: uncharacterized protein LCPAC102_02090 [Pithovirus LCPAC102]
MFSKISGDEIYDVIQYCYDKQYNKLGAEISFEWLESKNIKLRNYTNNIYHPLIIDEDNIYYILEKLTIMLYYVDEYKNIGYILSEMLSLNNTFVNVEMIRVNKEYYIDKLKYIEYIDLDIDYPRLELPKIENDTYRPMNPSILKTNDGYLINCRFVNYTQKKALHWTYLETESKIKTKNFIIHMDKKLNILSYHELIDASWRTKIDTSSVNVLGLEDCILFEHNKEIWFSCTTLDTEPFRIPKQNIGKLPKLNDISNKYEVMDIQVMKTEYGLKHMEKNWLPISSYKDNEKSIYFIYIHEYNNIKQVKYDVNDMTENIKDITFINNEQYINYPGLKYFRGSGGPIKFKVNNDIGFLSVIHEVIFRRDNGGRCYLHRFVYYDSYFNIQNISRLFYFDHLGVEFCRSITKSHVSSEILIGVGIEDGNSRIYKINTNIIRSMLIPLDKLKIINQ